MLQFNRTNEQMGTYSLDGENHFPRIERLLERYWECTPEVDIERAKDLYRSNIKRQKAKT